MQKILWLALAGSFGAVSRYGFFTIANRYLAGVFPWPTVAINGFGCFIFGIIYSLSETRVFLSGETRIILLVGFVGAFTTFSAFAFESTVFIKQSQWMLAALNILAENVVVIIALFIGLAVGRLV